MCCPPFAEREMSFYSKYGVSGEPFSCTGAAEGMDLEITVSRQHCSYLFENGRYFVMVRKKFWRTVKQCQY